MNKCFYILLVAFVALFSSCEKDVAGIADAIPENSMAELSFTYKNGRSTTRAIAKNYESVIHDLDIFAFLSNGTYIGQMIEGTDYSETYNADNTSTITVTASFIKKYAGQTLTFYFVGNNKTSNDNSTDTNTKHISSFSGTESKFNELLTKPLGSSPWWPHEKAEYFQITPTSGGMLMTGKTAAISLVGKQDVAVTLKRRMARFDIINPDTDILWITQIYIVDAATQGAMFADALGTNAIATRSIEVIDGPGISDNEHVKYDARGRAEGLFYLYPTSMAVTSIVIKGIINEKEMLFNVKSTNIDIGANKRYTLVFDEQTTDFIIKAGEWDDGGSIGFG